MNAFLLYVYIFVLKDTSAVHVVSGRRTAAYTLLLSATGDFLTGAGDMEVHDCILPTLVRNEVYSTRLRNP